MTPRSAAVKQSPGKGRRWEGEKYLAVFTWAGGLSGQTSNEVKECSRNAPGGARGEAAASFRSQHKLAKLAPSWRAQIFLQHPRLVGGCCAMPCPCPAPCHGAALPDDGQRARLLSTQRFAFFPTPLFENVRRCQEAARLCTRLNHQLNNDNPLNGVQT